MTPTPDGVGFLVSRIVIVAVPRLSVLCFEVSLNVYRIFRANFTYDVIPIALFQAPIYVTSATEVLM